LKMAFPKEVMVTRVAELGVTVMITGFIVQGLVSMVVQMAGTEKGHLREEHFLMGKELEKTFRDMNWIIGLLVLGREEKVIQILRSTTLGEEAVVFSSMEMVLSERTPLSVKDTGVVVLMVLTQDGKMDFPE